MIQTQNALAPFSCTYTPSIPELFNQLNISLCITTYQAGKVVFLSAKDNDHLVQLPRTFEKPMGIALHPQYDKIALACKNEVKIFSNSYSLAQHYPKNQHTYDALYLPRMSYHTGGLDVHDLKWGKDTLYGVNTLFSCIMKVSEDYSFESYWKPSFVSELVPEDRCHLNGMVMKNGVPKYATAFNQGNTRQSWRENITQTGVLLDVDDNRIIADGLAMPHTPKMINGELYVLLSATGQLVKVDVNSGEVEVVKELGGFVRGMTYHKEFLFIGQSKLRKNSSTFSHLEITDKANVSGITILHLPTRSIYGEIKYTSSVDEIYEVEVLAKKRPNILNTLNGAHNQAVTVPSGSYWAISEKINDKP